MPSAVPMGLKILAYSPTDKSVGYFHLSLWDKTQIYKNGEMLPTATRGHENGGFQVKAKWLCTLWGMNKPTLEDNLKVIKDAGFEGVEMKVPDDSAGRNRLGVLLSETGLDLVAQVRAEGATADAQIESLKKRISEVAVLTRLSQFAPENGHF